MGGGGGGTGGGGGAIGGGGGGTGGGGTIDAGICGGAWCLYSSAGNGVFPTSQGVWAGGPNNAYVTSWGSRILRWNGTAWQMVSSSSAELTYAVWGFGNKVLLGGEWGDTFLGPPFLAAQLIPGISANVVSVSGLPDGGSIYAGTDDGRLYALDGGAWTPAAIPALASNIALRGIAAVAQDDVWVAGSAATILHFDGATWQQLDAGVSPAERYRSAFATSASNVWFVGTNGIVTRWNGTALTTDYCITCSELWGVWGRSANDMWVVDKESQLVPWDGGSFGDSITPTANLVSNSEGNGLYGAGDNDLFVSAAFSDGGFGVLHYRR